MIGSSYATNAESLTWLRKRHETVPLRSGAAACLQADSIPRCSRASIFHRECCFPNKNMYYVSCLLWALSIKVLLFIDCCYCCCRSCRFVCVCAFRLCFCCCCYCFFFIHLIQNWNLLLSLLSLLSDISVVSESKKYTYIK